MSSRRLATLDAPPTSRAAKAAGARVAHLAEVLCFCHGHDQADGHPLTAEGCTATVKAGIYPQSMGMQRGWPPPSMGANSRLAEAIFIELAKVARTPEQKRQCRASAAILGSAATEHRAREARTGEGQRKIRLTNLSAVPR